MTLNYLYRRLENYRHKYLGGEKNSYYRNVLSFIKWIENDEKSSKLVRSLKTP